MLVNIDSKESWIGVSNNSNVKRLELKVVSCKPSLTICGSKKFGLNFCLFLRIGVLGIYVLFLSDGTYSASHGILSPYVISTISPLTNNGTGNVLLLPSRITLNTDTEFVDGIRSSYYYIIII